MDTPSSNLVARIENLKVHFPIRQGFLNLGKANYLKAVDGVSFELKKGEILGLVGESGCGKSSLGRAIMRLIRSAHLEGKVEVCGQDLMQLKGRKLRLARPKIQMVFQDPYASLDPRMTVFDILSEPLQTHSRLTSVEIQKEVFASLDRVGLPSKSSKKYPHEFSGGQRQRIAIARALILKPEVIIADEPVSSLDVSVQAQILNLLKSIQEELGLSMVFISHNLAVVKYISDRIAVMYLGKIVEVADKASLYRKPLHPYTQALVSAVPIPDPQLERNRPKIEVKGEIPSAAKPPKGCAFYSRCPVAMEKCQSNRPELEAKPDPLAASPRHVACFGV